MSLSEAIEPLVPTVAHLLLETFKTGQTHGRGALAYLLRVLPLLNRHACELWRKERQVPYLLTLCDYLYKSGHRDRYFDGVLFFKPGSPREGMAQGYPSLEEKPKTLLDLETIHVRRRKLAEKLSDNPALFCQPGLLGNSTLHVPAQFYLCIWQMHTVFREHPRYDQVFTECQRVGCTRPALLAPPAVVDDDDSESSEAEYWKCCRDGRSPPPRSSLPSDMSFCCHGCYKVTNSEFKRLLKFDIETPSTTPRTANVRSRYARRGADARIATPHQLYRAAVHRNLAVHRQLRSQPQVETRHYPSSMANREQLLRERTTMLSVDLGLLYAASLVYELPERLRPTCPLPNRDNWREHAKFYLGAVDAVRTIYLQHGHGQLARDSSELWLRRLRDQLLDIF